MSAHQDPSRPAAPRRAGDPFGSRVAGRTVAGVVFDMDGVIVESEHLWEIAWRDFSESRGRPWSLSDTLAVQGMSAPEWAAYLAEHVGAPGDADVARAHCVSDLVGRIEGGEAKLLPGARELVTEVSRRVPIALASSAARDVIDAVLGHYDLAGLFTATVSSEEVPRGKPSPDVYLAAVGKLGITPDTGLAVEDSSNGIRAAHAAGLLVVGIPNPTYPPKPEAAALADHLAADHVEAREFILARLSEGAHR
ncbi:HAD family hydrolase [Thermostaphylospora chromogena]|uniref:Haloacid dehalogenase superfamily, subfamily IA, variant 3 with third motif having DD or ED n=1 Tax=Thermostaphylospora chromogena TaxID=35622 RepID=A0A1H1GSC8_9ACTN|nr:HAD family phosphatase [Thermostaphylospora chromogena]SDR16049.1 haloacid dehalogenase superfamily, subfamily IA, variant 3 with third motif having DD or ED [Thermostaphylospora chromogena]